jgi:hypothetical protein
MLIFALGVWLLCGLVGDILLDARGSFHWSHVVWGPVTMANVFFAR